MIPKVLHYVWVGPDPMPADQRSWVQGWRELMPGWKIRHWGNGDIDWNVPFLRQAASVHAWNRISDYLRMHALAAVGGVYLDTDVEMIKPLDPLLAYGACAFLGAQEMDCDSPNLFSAAILGSPPGHWLPEAAKSRLEELDARDDLDCYTGPGVITEVLRERGIEHYPSEPIEESGVRVYPIDYFYPYSWTQFFDEGCVTENTYTIHHWAHSWNPARGSRVTRARRKVGKLLARIAPARSVKAVQRTLQK
jgi:mannosyltransferase OCH1-like enzyme